MSLGRPRLHLTLCFVARDAVALLNFADELLAPSLNLIQVIVRELAPLLARLALKLCPLSNALRDDAIRAVARSISDTQSTHASVQL
jgi:hypothetical protein